MAEPIVATYSIAACDLDAGQWGVATQSKFLAVGSVVPWAEPGVGAVATQAYANPRYGPDGLALLRGGASAEETVATADRRPTTAATRASSASSTRTVAARPSPARGASTGRAARPGRASPRRGTSSSAPRPWQRSPRRSPRPQGRPLAQRLIDCLAAAQAAGGDRRGQQSAALLRRRAGRRVCRAQRRARRPARRRPRAADRRARPHLRPARPAVRQDATRPVARGRRRARRRAGRAPRALGYDGALDRGARLPGRAPRTSRNGSTVSIRSTPSCCESCGRDERRRLRDPLDRRPRAPADDGRHADPAAAAPAARLPAVRR